MPKITHWTDTFPLLILMSAAFVAGALTALKFTPFVVDVFADACSSSAAPGRVQWETLVAGSLGLLGGSFAYIAAKVSIAANEKQRKLETERNIKKAQADFCIETYFAARNIVDNANLLSPWFKEEHYPGDDACRISIEALDEIDIPNAPYILGAEMVSQVQSLQRTKRLIIRLIENSILATDQHNQRNEVIHFTLESMKKGAEELSQLTKKGLENIQSKNKTPDIST